jgi:hypothetical protein
MRKGMGLALFLGLAMTGPAWAQSFGGVNPANIVYTPVDTSQLNVPIAQPQQGRLTSFSLSSLFPNHPVMPGGNQAFGFSHYPTPAQMPGANWLKAFHYQAPGRPAPRAAGN